MEYGLIGAGLNHSCLPALHARLGGCRCRLPELSEQDFIDLLARRAFSSLRSGRSG